MGSMLFISATNKYTTVLTAILSWGCKQKQIMSEKETEVLPGGRKYWKKGGIMAFFSYKENNNLKEKQHLLIWDKNTAFSYKPRLTSYLLWLQQR